MLKPLLWQWEEQWMMLSSLLQLELPLLVKQVATSESACKHQSLHGGTGLTIAKLRTAKQTFDLASVDPSIPRHIVVGPEQINNLLGTTQVTSHQISIL
jgi:hypothetical protein